MKCLLDDDDHGRLGHWTIYPVLYRESVQLFRKRMSCFQLDSCTRPGDHIRMAAKLSADEASAYLGVSRTTFYKRVRKGLPVVQIGARTVFDAVDLDAWAEQHKAVPRAPAVVRPPVRSFKPEPAPGTCYIDEAGKLRLWPEASTLGRERGR